MQQPGVGVQMGQQQSQYGQQPSGYGQQPPPPPPPQYWQPQPQAGYVQGMPPNMQAQQFQHSNSLPPPAPPASPAFAGTPGLRKDTRPIGLPHKTVTQERAPKPEVFASVLEWLTSMGCEEYWDKFEEDGYDDMDTIVDLTSEDLAELGVEKKGHLIKITKSLKKMIA